MDEVNEWAIKTWRFVIAAVVLMFVGAIVIDVVSMIFGDRTSWDREFEYRFEDRGCDHMSGDYRSLCIETIVREMRQDGWTREQDGERAIFR